MGWRRSRRRASPRGTPTATARIGCSTGTGTPLTQVGLSTTGVVLPGGEASTRRALTKRTRVHAFASRAQVRTDTTGTDSYCPLAHVAGWVRTVTSAHMGGA